MKTTVVCNKYWQHTKKAAAAKLNVSEEQNNNNFTYKRTIKRTKHKIATTPFFRCYSSFTLLTNNVR